MRALNPRLPQLHAASLPPASVLQCAGETWSPALLCAAAKSELKRVKTGQNNAKHSGNSDPNACVWIPEVPGGRPLAIGQAHYGEVSLGQGLPEQTPPGNSLNPISSSYLPINAGPLPPRSCVAGNAII